MLDAARRAVELAMSDVWSERAELYRQSAAHSEGADLDLVVEWAAGCETAIDVATGGGHVARRLRAAGLSVVSCDPSPGMQPDVICFAEDLPFAVGSFDLAVTRVAAHHFADVAAATRELARVAAKRVIVVDNLSMGEGARRGGADPRSVARAQLQRGRVARVLHGCRARGRRRAHVRLPDRARAVARAHRMSR